MARRHRSWLAAVALSILFAPSVRADDEEGDAEEPPKDSEAAEKALAKFVPEFLKAMRDYDTDVVRVVAERFPPEALALAPKALYAIGEGTARFGPRLARDAEATTSKLATMLVEAGEKALATWPKDPKAMRALAAALGARVRIRVAQKEDVPPEDLARIAELMVSAYEGDATDGGTSGALAIRWLRQAGLVPAPAPLIPAHAQAVYDKVAEKAGEGAPLTWAKAELRLAQAQGAIAARKAQAKPLLDECLACAERLIAERPTEQAWLTLHCDAMTTAKAAKIPVKGDYRLDTRITGGKYLQFSHPRGDYWRSSSSEGDRELYSVDQWDARGVYVRHVTMSYYRWDTNYTDADGKTGGDNVKGLARQDQRLRREDFGAITKEKELTKGTLGKTAGAQAYEIIGTDKQGRFLRVRVWYLKAKDAPVTLEIVFYEYEDLGRIDPEADAFLDSLMEAKKK